LLVAGHRATVARRDSRPWRDRVVLPALSLSKGPRSAPPPLDRLGVDKKGQIESVTGVHSRYFGEKLPGVITGWTLLTALLVNNGTLIRYPYRYPPANKKGRTLRPAFLLEFHVPGSMFQVQTVGCVLQGCWLPRGASNTSPCQRRLRRNHVTILQQMMRRGGTSQRQPSPCPLRGRRSSPRRSSGSVPP